MYIFCMPDTKHHVINETYGTDQEWMKICLKTTNKYTWWMNWHLKKMVGYIWEQDKLKLSYDSGICQHMPQSKMVF